MPQPTYTKATKINRPNQRESSEGEPFTVKGSEISSAELKIENALVEPPQTSPTNHISQSPQSPCESTPKTPRSSGKRIYFSISSEGFGHSSRVLALAKGLGDDEFLVGTYHYAAQRIESFGYPCVRVPQEVEFIGEQGSFHIGKTLIHNRARAINLNDVVEHEMDIMQKYRISLVVADGRVAPVIAASKLKLPCVLMTNQSAYYPFFSQDTPLVKLFGHSFEWVMQQWMSGAEEILIPDFPPPYTVCLPNLSELPQVKKRTRFVGPLVAWNPEDVVAVPRPESHPEKPLIVATMGGHAYRRPLFDAVLELARTSGSDYNFYILSAFTAQDVPPNVTLVHCPKDAAPYFKAADVVLTQAGHSTAMELLTLGKPSVVVPDLGQIEQENNARRLVELGVSRQVTYEQLSVASLYQSIEALRESPSFYHQAQHLAGLTGQLNSRRHVLQILEDYATRLAAY